MHKEFNGDVTVFIGDISDVYENEALYDKYFSRLSEYRREKCLKLKQRTDKVRSVCAGALLDKALSGFGLKESDICYGKGIYGKPFIANLENIHFNLSHSKLRVMCAIAETEVGCDVESIGREHKRISRIAERFFCEEEKRELFEAGKRSEAELKDMFCKIWTMKESFIKCTGEGLQRPLNGFSVFDEKTLISKTDTSFIRLFSVKRDDYRYAVAVKTPYDLAKDRIKVISVKL